MPWIKAIDKYPDGFQLARKIGSYKNTPMMFAPHVIASHDGKTYKKEEVEYLDESELAFTIEDMKQSYDHGKLYGFEKSGTGHTSESFEKFMMLKYNIDINK